MNVVERYAATYRHQPTDRVAIALSYFHPKFQRQHAFSGQDDRIEQGIAAQLCYGFDPHLAVRGTGRDWFLAEPDLGSPKSAGEPTTSPTDWQVTRKIVHQPGGIIRTDYHITTSTGTLDCTRRQAPDDFGVIDAPFIKHEADIEMLRHRPAPGDVISQSMIRQDVQAMGNRCWPMAHIAGVWSQASFFRGPDTILYDLYDRPEWVKRFLALLGEYQIELVKEIAQASDQIIIRMDASFVGFGLSRAMYTEFLQPHDAAIVAAAHRAGLRVHLHICGKKNAFLEDLADTGIDALETLTPPSASGDVELADAKQRIGGRVCLMGGFPSPLLTKGNPEKIAEEVEMCLSKAATGGGYILSPSGRIDPGTPEENLLAFTQAGRHYVTRD